MSESVKTTNGRVHLQNLRYWDDQIQNIKKKICLFKMLREIKMLPEKPGKYENEQRLRN